MGGGEDKAERSWEGQKTQEVHLSEPQKNARQRGGTLLMGRPERGDLGGKGQTPIGWGSTGLVTVRDLRLLQGLPPTPKPGFESLVPDVRPSGFTEPPKPPWDLVQGFSVLQAPRLSRSATRRRPAPALPSRAGTPGPSVGRRGFLRARGRERPSLTAGERLPERARLRRAAHPSSLLNPHRVAGVPPDTSRCCPPLRSVRGPLLRSSGRSSRPRL